jgi:hypothetical protein
MHTHVFLLLPTPILHSYVIEEKKTRREKKEKTKKKQTAKLKGKEGGRTYVRVVVFVRSVSCRAVYCGVASGATATRNIVVALRFSHHHQQAAAAAVAAIAVIATESERERKKRPHPRVCV